MIAGGLGVIVELGGISICQRFNGFEFDDDFLIDKEIGAEFAGDDFLVADIQLGLALVGNASQDEFMGGGFLVHRFQEAWAKNSVHFHGSADACPEPVEGIVYVKSL